MIYIAYAILVFDYILLIGFLKGSALGRLSETEINQSVVMIFVIFPALAGLFYYLSL